jgi:isocitrate dehydrogenase kinase/phosphatase
LLPGKRLAEIYIGLGFHKHGKTELYRDLLKHQKMCGQDRFDVSPGKRGMVMIAFNMPGDDLIYKLIRDRFDSPKKTTAKQVMQKYDYVFKHDRAGRLLDVQTFENLELDECCFTQRCWKRSAARPSRLPAASMAMWCCITPMLNAGLPPGCLPRNG